MYIAIWQTRVTGSADGFRFSDEALYIANFGGIDLVGLLGADKGSHLLVDRPQITAVLSKAFFEVDGKFNVTQHVIIPDGGIAGGLVSYMHIMALVNQSDECATH